MRSIIHWAVSARVLVVVIAAALVFFGSRQIEDTKVDTLPEFEPTIVEVQTEALGLSAHEVEQLITVPLEADLLAGVAWLDVIRSESLPGLSRVTMIFEPGTDVMRARQVVQERLTQAAVGLPNVSKAPNMLQPTSSTSRVMMVSLTSEQVSLIDMSVLSRWTIKPRLLGVEGVANVSIYGYRDQQLQVLVDQARLKEKGVTLDDVLATTGNSLFVSPLTFLEASVPGTGGFIETPQQRLGVQHVQPLSTPEELAQIPIEGHPNVLLSDVATLVEDHQPLIGDAVLKDGQPGLLLVIEKFPGTSTIEVTNDVEAALDSLAPALPGIQVDSTVYRPATSIESSIDDLTVAAGVAFVLVAIVLALFFFGWRAALISAVSIPSSLFVAGLVLGITGNSFNIIVVAGLVMALAVLVDEAIIDLDNLTRRRRENLAEGREEDGESSILAAALQMRAPMMTAMLIIFLSVVPLFFLDGVAAEFYPQMATAYGLAVGAAMLVSLTLTPALAAFLMSNAPAREDPPLVAALKRAYTTALARFINIRGAALVGAALIAAIGLVSVTGLSEHSVLPDLKQRELLIRYDAAPGTSEGEMSRVVNAATAELQAIPGVKTVGAHVGRAINSDEVVDVHTGEIWVTVDSGNYDSTAGAIREVVDGYPGFSSSVGSYANERVNADLAGTGRDVTARVYGENQTVLREKADEVLAAMSAVDGVEDARIEAPVEGPALEIEVDLEAAERYGIAPGDVRRTAATLLSGLSVGNLFEQQKVFDVVVWSTPETRSSVTAIQNLAIDTSDGGQVRLADVADVRIAPNLAVINRDQVSRYIDVTADTSGAGVRNDIERALDGIPFPQEHRVELIDNEGRLEVENLGIALAVGAAIIMFLLLQLAFGSWRLAGLAFVLVPGALAGGAVAAYLDGGDLTIGSYAGFLALLAISTRHGMALISGLQARAEQQGVKLDLGGVLSGTQERAAPVLMATLATALGLLPLLFTSGGFGHEIVAPMAIVILGGLVSSLAINLFILPALYLQFAPEPETALAQAHVSISQEEASAS
jgi:Cu/Ag efflux pump CusA